MRKSLDEEDLSTEANGRRVEEGEFSSYTHTGEIEISKG